MRREMIPVWYVFAVETSWDALPGWSLVDLFTSKRLANEKMHGFTVALKGQRYRVRRVRVWGTVVR